jgi:hypothetical protein
MAGFEFSETMAGSFRLAGEPLDRAMSFTLRARSFTWASFLRRPEVAIEGEIDAEGFADHRYLQGTLGMDPLGVLQTLGAAPADFPRGRVLPYAFRFTANDRAPYSFAGKKTLHLGSLVESMTVLPGAILDAGGKRVAEALLRFDLRSDLGRFLRSFRLA